MIKFSNNGTKARQAIMAAQCRRTTIVRLATKVRRAGGNDGSTRAGVNAITEEAHPAEDERTKIQTFHTFDFADRWGRRSRFEKCIGR